MMHRWTTCALLTSLVVLGGAHRAPAQQTAPPPAAVRAAAVSSPVLPTGYTIGPKDILSIVFWRDEKMSAEVVVRPDGKISLPLLNEVQAAGLTPEQLRAVLVEGANKYLEDPTATVVVKEIHSRNVYITGNVSRADTYPLTSDMTVIQLIAQAGGLLEYSDAENIVIIRTEGGRAQYIKFNYKDVISGKRPEQNIALKPGDTVVVP
jgi:polysaccharide export outer membrane protein